jgi:hypothetical protein
MTSYRNLHDPTDMGVPMDGEKELEIFTHGGSD